MVVRDGSVYPVKSFVVSVVQRNLKIDAIHRVIESSSFHHWVHKAALLRMCFLLSVAMSRSCMFVAVRAAFVL